MDDSKDDFRKASKYLDQNPNEKESVPSQPPLNQEVEIAKRMINAYRENYKDIDLNVLRNLIELKDITQAPKQDNPESSFLFIKQRLGEAESQETFRQERWHNRVTCPRCRSYNVKRSPKPNQEENNDAYQYQCLACQNIFEDQTGTPMESGVPPISIWMFCWYLLGCTDSMQYIASKLGLEISVVERMVQQMRKLFRAQQPLTHFMTFEEWSLKHGKSYKQRILHEIAKKQELFQGENPNAPTDTAEYRRQKMRARNPNNHTPGSTVNPNRPKPKNRGN